MDNHDSVSFAVYETATGRILWTGVCLPEMAADQARPPERGCFLGEADPATQWINPATGGLEARPVTGLPDLAVIAAAVDWHVEDVPAGTEVLIDGEPIEDGIVGTAGLTIRFEYAEIYLLELRPPFPWRYGRCRVTVE